MVRKEISKSIFVLKEKGFKIFLRNRLKIYFFCTFQVIVINTIMVNNNSMVDIVITVRPLNMLKLPPMPLCQEIRKIGIGKILPLFPVTLMVVRSAKKKLPMLSVNHWEKSCLRHHYRHQIG